MKKIKNAGRIVIALLLCLMFFASGTFDVTSFASSSGKINVSLVGKYDSADVAAIRDIDLDKKIIRFRNHSTGRTYTLSYDNTSMMYDKYGQPLSPGLLSIGEIVEVTFLKSTKNITTLNISDQAWTIENTRDHDLVRGDGTARIKKDIYKLDVRTLVMAEDELALAEDVLATDRITAKGIGKDVYSVVVTSGHGYVSLSSDTVEERSLVGAWIELDNEVIHKISPNMLLSAPEGDYKLQILGNGANYQSNVSINRNQETVVDTGKVTISRPKEGLVTFEIKPEEAEVFVDGKKVLTGTPQTIQYGYHNLKIMADGYETQTKYLKVGTPKSVIRIELEKESSAASESSSEASDKSSDEASKKASKTDKTKEKSSKDSSKKASSAASSASTGSVSENSSSGNSKNKVIKGYRIYVDEPYEVELYLDGNYIGITPTSFTKVSGTHEIILKKEGYKTKSYRVSIDTEEEDYTYRFPDLVKIKKDESSEGKSSDKPSDSSSESSSEAPSEASSESSSGSDGGSSASSETSSSGSSEDDDSGASTASSKESSDEGATDGSSEAGTGASGEDDEAGDAASAASGSN